MTNSGATLWTLCRLVMFAHTCNNRLAAALGFAGSQETLSPAHLDTSTDADFHGLTTFANLPYTNCFRENDDVNAYDIAILGAPFDTVSQRVANLL